MAENGKLKIYVLDCLNEVRYKGSLSKQKVKDAISTEENKLGRPDIDENGKIILTKESLEMKNYYDQHNLDPYLHDLETGDPSYTYYGLLDYSLRSQNDYRIMNDKECHKQNSDYIENIINTCQGIYQKTNTQKKNFFVGTHGNRLKAALGIKGIDIANCFCLKISLNKTEILFDGFKMYEGERNPELTITSGFGRYYTHGTVTKKKRKCYVHKQKPSNFKFLNMNACYKKTIKKKKNKNDIISYNLSEDFKKNNPNLGNQEIQKIKNITTDENTKLVRNYTYKFESSVNLVHPINIYIIRHGDAMHNDKFNLGHNNIDSSLTPIGMMQAYLVGEEILENNKNKSGPITLKNSCILSSYLNRAQHTALLALYSACGYPPRDPYFKSVTNLFNNMAFTRVYKKIKDKKNKINFIKNKIKDFCEQNEALYKEEVYETIIDELPEELKKYKNYYLNVE